jgi:Brp/Blh family beta-carotene 15,15'-monooxygenase
MLVPGWSLLFFLLITAWHFGESDLLSLGIRRMHPLLIFCYGLCITVWLLWQHPAELLEWTAVISQGSGLMRAVVEGVAAVPVMVFYGALGVLILAHPPHREGSVARRIVFLLFLYLLSHTSLLIGFVLYFAGWHSVNALFHLRVLAFRKGSLLRMLRLALPVFLMALTLLAAIAFFTEVRWLEKNGLPALFVLLSVLTLPHMTEMHRLYSQRNRVY